MAPACTITLQVEQLKKLLTDTEADVAKFDKGNKAAGRRVRKAMQGIKLYAQGVRETVILK